MRITMKKDLKHDQQEHSTEGKAPVLVMSRAGRGMHPVSNV